MPSRRALWCLASLVGLSCAPRQQAFQPMTGAGTTADIDALVRAALALDAAGERAADTLYAPEAVVYANARQRFATPRFAGISYGGRVTLAGSSVTLQGTWAWAFVDYRWIGQGRQPEVGRATLILVRRMAGWRILHAHSSQLLPWDR